MTIEQHLMKQSEWNCLRQAMLERLDGDVFVRKDRTVLFLTDSFSPIIPKEIDRISIVISGNGVCSGS